MLPQPSLVQPQGKKEWSICEEQREGSSENQTQKKVTSGFWFRLRSGGCGSYLTFDASQAAAARFRFAEALAVAAAVLPGDPQLVKLPLLFLINLFHPCCFQQRIAAFRCVRLEEGALVQVGSADVDVVFGDVVHRQLLSLGTLLGTVLSQLRTRTSIMPPLSGRKIAHRDLYASSRLAHHHLESFQLLLSESVEELLTAEDALLHGELGERVRAEHAVALLHAKSASSSTGDAGESLATWEEEHRHLVKGHVAPSCFLCFLWDGCRCGGREKKMTLEYNVTENFDTFFQMLLVCATRWRCAPPLEMCANPAERLSGTPL